MLWFHHGSPAFSLVCVCVPVCIIPPVSLPLSVLCVCAWFALHRQQPGGSHLQTTPFKSSGFPTAGCQIVSSVNVVVWILAPLYFLPSCSVLWLVKLIPLCFFNLALDCCAVLSFASFLLASGPACLLPASLCSHSVLSTKKTDHSAPCRSTAIVLQRTSCHNTFTQALTCDFTHHVWILGLCTNPPPRTCFAPFWSLKTFCCYTVNQSWVVHLGPDPTQNRNIQRIMELSFYDTGMFNKM